MTRPRETMRRLPRPVQPFLTWVTGVPLAGDRLRVLWRPTLALIAGVVQTAVGIAVGVYGLTRPWYLLLPLVLLSWPTTAGGMRRLDVVVVHQTLHRMFTASTAGNRVVSELVTTLLWRPPYDGNRQEHLTHHAFPCSLKDGDTLYLRSTGARPGMTRQQFRRYLLRAVLSPAHHWGFFSSRVKANFLTRKPLYRAVMAYAHLVGTVGFLVLTGWWLQWLLFWFLPVTFFFQNQTLLYTLSEHRWWLYDNAERLTKAQRDQLTFGRFCGRPAPDTAGKGALTRWAAWTGWWLRMVLLYAPYRMWILVGDTVQHDLHHVRPKVDWANSSWIRNEDLATGNADRYFEAWGGLLTHVYVGNSVRDWTAEPSAPLAPARAEASR
ncbi:fatty acid desaturase [Streptomyces sp. WMMC940]|uniref:fatty acid desaturase n=1 Tax=Streptomyces sp. WMMC940 TaxID=3015153 RepID=UPI0022B6E7E7|nr:fatty acid desaturase [Streptomyces sp. WMMC940]MCZ7462269.1 fatty acid desaturase [Streptomyces sp. WMMC940]